MQRFVILRDDAVPAGTFRSGMTFGTKSVNPGAKPALVVQELSKKDTHDIARDPKTFAIARVMPIKLIRPYAAAASATMSDAWGISAVAADKSSRTGADIVVAVLDTGIDAAHPAFEGVKIVQQDFTGTGNGDKDGHGTHCAATIFGRDVNGIRIGVAPGVTRALIGKVLGPDGRGDSEMIANAMGWAMEAGANVVSMSLGIDFPGYVKQMIEEECWPADLATSRALEDYRANVRLFDSLVQMADRRASAFGAGTLIVAAAGNESQRSRTPPIEIAASLPASALDVISVGALEPRPDGFGIAQFSNAGPMLSAPGTDILSARATGGLIALSGTSMACPHVAGIACLWWDDLTKAAQVPANANTVRNKLLSTARTNVFAPEVEFADRGYGVVTAPI